MRIPIASFVAAALLALAACGQPPRPIAPEPAPERPVLAPVAWDSAADPGEVAAWALRGCGGALAERRACVERALGSVLASAGVAKAMAALDRIAAADTTLLPDAHGLAHGLGIAAYRSPETVTEVYDQCPPTQIAGCYHGVIQGYFLDVSRRTGRVGTDALNALCEPQRKEVGRFLECSHGVGHGLMALVRHRLPDALAACDSVRDPGGRENCYGGAFMENVVGATHPEHTAEAHSAVGHGARGQGADGAHAHHAAADRGEWKPLDPADPLYPCNAVRFHYRHACYGIHTAAILFHNGGDFAAAARTCAGADTLFVRTCWRSLGRDITAYARLDPARTAEMCAAAGARAQPWCLRGASHTLARIMGDPDDGLALCRLAPAGESRARCYEGVGAVLPALEPDAARREAVCAAVEPAHVADCRRLADVARRDGS